MQTRTEPAVGARKRWQEYMAALLAGALGVCWFIQGHGGRALNPNRVDWLMEGDWSQHLTGWLFFRTAPLQLPLGALPNLAHPLGTTLGYTDATPLVALLLRPFVEVLPFPFQYVGPWLALCFALQGFLGARLTALFSPRPVAQVLGGALFALAPVLLWRMGHESLCAHWLLIGLIWVNLHEGAERAAVKRSVALVFLLVGLGAAIHPYLAVMALAMGVAALVRLRVVDRTLSWLALALGVGGLVAFQLGLFWLLGYVGTGIPSGLDGFGELSSDLLTLVNPMGWSRLLPTLRTARGQYEGFGYLGAGVLFSVVVGVGSALVLRKRAEWTPQWRRAVPLAVCCLALGLFALSSHVTFAGELVLDLQALYRPVLEWVTPFRSSGRFIWPLHYALLTGGIALVLGAWRSWPRVGTGVLAVAVGVQAFDLSQALARERFRGHHWNRLTSRGWDEMAGDYRHLVLYPPQLHDGNGRGCPYPGGGAPFSPMFAYKAAQLGMTFNSAYLARVNAERAQAYCNALREEIQGGVLQPRTVYVVRPGYLTPFVSRPDVAACGRLDGYVVCVSTAQQGAFRRVLAQHPM